MCALARSSHRRLLFAFDAEARRQVWRRFVQSIFFMKPPGSTLRTGEMLHSFERRQYGDTCCENRVLVEGLCRTLCWTRRTVKHDQTVQLEATDWAAVNPDIGSHDCDRLASDTSTDSQRQNNFLKAFTTFYNTTIDCQLLWCGSTCPGQNASEASVSKRPNVRALLK